MIQAVPDYKPTVRDRKLEAEMQRVLEQYGKTANRAQRKMLWEQYKRLHKRRSPGMRRWLEEQKGLR